MGNKSFLEKMAQSAREGFSDDNRTFKQCIQNTILLTIHYKPAIAFGSLVYNSAAAANRIINSAGRVYLGNKKFLDYFTFV